MRVYKHEGNHLSTWVDSNRGQGGNGFKLKEGRLRLDVGGSFSLTGWWGASTGCPERLGIFCPWRCTRPSWLGPCADWSSTWSSSWQPCLLEWGWNLEILEVPSNTSHSMINESIRTLCILKSLSTAQQHWASSKKKSWKISKAQTSKHQNSCLHPCLPSASIFRDSL